MKQDQDAPKVIIGLGEILWDIFPDGAKFGGAPANFACSTAGLKSIPAEVFMLSAVGNDELGQKATEKLEAYGVEVDWLQQNDKMTGQVNVTIDDTGSASYEFATDTAWDNLSWSDDLVELAAKTDAVCWGTLGQRCQLSQRTIEEFVSRTSPDCLRVLDVNLRPPFWTQPLLKSSIQLANALKCNEEELPILSDTFDLQGDAWSIMMQLQKRFALKLVAVTRGSQDSILLLKDQKTGELKRSQLPAAPTNVVDTVGAGDCFTAAIVLGLLGKMNLSDLHQWACRVSSYVCSQAGATPVIPKELRQPEIRQIQ